MEMTVLAKQHVVERTHLQHTLHGLTHPLLMHTNIYSYNQLSVHSTQLHIVSGNSCKDMSFFGLSWHPFMSPHVLIITTPWMYVFCMLRTSIYFLGGSVSHALISLHHVWLGNLQALCRLGFIIGGVRLTFVDSQATVWQRLAAPRLACLSTRP